MKKLLLFLLFCCSATALVQAQTAASYVFSQTTGTYTALTGTAADVFSSDWDDDVTDAGTIPLAFSFNYLGTDYSSIGVCANGWIYFGTTTPSSSYIPLNEVPLSVTGFANDMYPIAGASAIRYITTGSAPNRVFTIEWKDICHYDVEASGPLNYQIRLYESSNVIEFIYGSMTPTANANTAEKRRMSVGIAGITNDDFKARTTTTNWSATTNAGSNTTRCTQSITVIPANGLTFRFTPPPTIAVAPTALTFTEVAGNTSAGQDVALKAMGLTAGSVSIAVPANYQVYNGTTWVTSMSVPVSTAAVGTYINTMIPARFIAPATTGAYNGTLAFSSTGATTQNVALTGNSANLCGGTPTAGTVTATVTSGSCTAYSSTLSLTGATVAGGISYQWQSSPNDGAYTDVPGATLSTYTASISSDIYYRCRLTCSATSFSNTTPGLPFTYGSCIIMPSSGSGSATTCNAMFYDSGGAGDIYGDDENGTFTFYPATPGAKIRVTFTNLFLEECCDELQVYDGNSTSAPSLGSYTGEPYGSLPLVFTSTAADGSLTFHMLSDGSLTYDGWVANVTCFIPPPSAVATPPSLNFGGVTTGTNSAAYTFSLTGFNLIPSAGNMTVTAPANFQVSPNGTTWTSACTIPYTGAYLPAAPVYVRFNPVATVAYTGTVTVTGGGLASPLNVPVTGVGATACNSMPTAGTVNATVTSGTCTPYSSTLTLTGTTVSGGIIYQWETSPDNSSWTPVSGATTNTYILSVNNTLYYRCRVTCTTTSQTQSTAGVLLSYSDCVVMPPSGSGSSTTCSTLFYDSGGPGNDYNDDEDATYTFYPATPGAKIKVTFSELYMEGCCDGLEIFNGNSTSAASLGSYTGEPYDPLPLTITSTAPDGSLTFHMSSDGSATYSGWVANVTCYIPPPSGSATPASLAFGYVTTGTNSAAQTFSATGLNLVPSSGNTTVTAPANFQVSANGTTWSSSYTIPYTSGFMPSTTVYVRFNPAASIAYTGTVTVTGGGLAAPLNVAVTGNGASACSGMPAAGTATATPSGGNAATLIALTLAGYTLDGGISFQWQSSPNGTTGWTDISGATLAAYNFSGLASTTYYRCNVTCGAFTAPSTVTSVLFIPAPICVTTAASWTDESGSADYGVNSFNITGFSGSTLADNNITSDANGSTGYLDRTAMAPVNLQQNGAYSSSITYGTLGNYQEFQVWIDFNNNGTFETAEEVTPVLGYDPDNESVNPVNFTINIPMTAPVGIHLMRIRGIWETVSEGTSLSTHLDPCLNRYNGVPPEYYSGTAVDYFVNIVQLPACTGTPTPGSATASVLTGCAAYTSDLSLTGTLIASGLNYQWQSSATDGSYTDIPNATNPAYTANVSISMYYRARIGCTSSGLSAPTTSIQLVLNTPPTAITGTMSMCAGATATLNSTPAGGVWTSSNTATATIGSSSGVVNGLQGGSTNIIYTIPATGCTRSAVVTINATPSVIALTPAASGAVCLGSGMAFTANAPYPSTILTGDFNSGLGDWTIDNTGNSAPNGVWTPESDGYIYNGSTTFNSPDASGFMLANSDQGGVNDLHTQLVSPGFSLSGYSAATLTFQHFYRYIGNDLSAKVDISTDGGTTWNTLQDYLAGGASEGSATAFATATFNLSAYLGQGNCKLRFNYNSNNGWWWAIDNVSITGTPPTVNYTWAGVSGATGLSCTSCATATITPTALGNNIYSVTATANGCSRTSGVTVSVNPLPDVITGTNVVCAGLTTTLANSTANGTWTSGNTGIATIGSSSGIVTGQAAGTANVSYTLTATGCSSSRIVTVNPQPSTITGTMDVCVNSTTTLADADGGGTWTSGSSSIATIGSASGIVSGISAGLATITYTLPTSCIRTTTVSVNALPSLTITPPAAPAICIGSNVSFTANAPVPDLTILDQDFNTGLNGWAISSAFGDPTSVWQIVSSGYDGSSGDGSAMMQSAPTLTGAVNTMLTSVPFSTAGYGSATLTFNQYLLSDGTDPAIAVEYSIDGGTNWLMLLDQAGVISGNGTWSATTPEATVYLPANALGQPSVLLRWNYGGSSFHWMIDNVKVKASLPAATYMWTGIAGASGLSCTACATPTITPAASGNNIYSVAATSSAGCTSTGGVTVSVNPLPVAIGGTLQVCNGLSTTLTDGDAGGIWASANTGVATIGTSGIVMGVNAGTATIIYTLPTTCNTTIVVTVDPLPSAITGTAEVCEGFTSMLSNSDGGGTWTSGNTSVAMIGTSGMITGIGAGTAAITYTLPTTCMTTRIVTVNALPDEITGTATVCAGSATSLSDATGSGTWSSSDGGIASVSVTGSVAGIAAGTSTIVYTLSTGCIRTKEVTVNPLPANIGGTLHTCEATTATLTNSDGGGTWSSNTTSVATANVTTGEITGIASGVTDIVYTLGTGCSTTSEFTVDALPADITGIMHVCERLSTTLSSTSGSGLWFSGATDTATVDATSGSVTGVAAGTATISYALSTGCMKTTTVTVDPTPAAITGVMRVCPNATTILSNADAGGNWSTGYPATATIDAMGALTGITAGNVDITYTLPTGCINTTNVTVDPLPMVYAVTGGGSYCFGGNGVHVGLSNSETGYAYDLYKGAVAIGTMTGTGTAIDFGLKTDAGTYTVAATSTHSCRSDMSTSAIVSITPLITPSVSVISLGGNNICAGTHVTFVPDPVNGGMTPGFEWSVNGTVMSTGISYNYTPADGDQVSVRLISSEACPSPASVTDMIVMTVISDQLPSVNIAVSPSSSVCQFSTVVFNATSLWSGDLPEYTWMVNGMNLGSGTSFAYVPSNGDAVICKLHSNYRCLSANDVSSNSIAMNVRSILPPSVSITAQPGTVIKTSTTVTLNAVVTDAGPVSYKWYKNNTAIAGATNATYISNAFANNDSMTCVVEGTGQCAYHTYNAVIMKIDNTTGITGTTGSNNMVMLIPDPNNGKFIIRGTLGSSTNEEVYIDIADMLGQIVHREKVNLRAGTIEQPIHLANTLANGIYILNIRSSVDNIVLHFVLKQ